MTVTGFLNLQVCVEVMYDMYNKFTNWNKCSWKSLFEKKNREKEIITKGRMKKKQTSWKGKGRTDKRKKKENG